MKEEGSAVCGLTQQQPEDADETMPAMQRSVQQLQQQNSATDMCQNHSAVRSPNVSVRGFICRRRWITCCTVWSHQFIAVA